MALSTAPDRNFPAIRDHETLRMIGRGAYGEVWMARSVTGALRAVKVVWREDYDYPEAFEREFEAIKRYEPISRRHAGLVPILQVGRSDADGFYYYIMELADDVEKGRDIDPESYRPLTMAAKMRKGGRLGAEECIKHGENIADALHYLHQNGLIHRDVKPANLIFEDGSCRLADIGLVALLGQRSFVGTEGFVAPEGPGSPQSDIFSLGMVLYEASTGKDRLDFPDLPSARETGERIELWRRLQSVVCRACAHQAKERFSSARDMAQALRGEVILDRRARRRWYVLGAALGTAAVLVAGGFAWLRKGDEIKHALHHSQPLLTLRSDPPGAQVYSNGNLLGVTPLALTPTEDVAALYQIRLPGYRAQEIEHTARKRSPATYELKLEKSRLPQPGERWTNSLGMSFVPKQAGHTSAHPVEMKYFDKFVKATGRAFEGRVVPYVPHGENDPHSDKDAAYIVVVPIADAEAFRFWLTERDREGGYLANEHHYEIETMSYVDTSSAADDAADPKGQAKPDETAFWLKVERQGYGSVVVRSNPVGAKVFQREELLGITPLELPRVRTGEVEYELRSEGFSDVLVEGEVRENELTELYQNMIKTRGVSFGRDWKNSLGMKFLPLGDVMLSVWETRRKEFMEFVKATGARRPMSVNSEQGGKGASMPVVGVDREEARTFCSWLTKRERELGLIGPDDRYRLPTDEEWSRAVGLPLERGNDPAERNGRIRGVFPWGYEWPPPAGVDNFADENAGKAGGLTTYIPGYKDHAATLSAVTALPAGPKGFVGLAGNASEWVETDFYADPTKGVVGTVRGGNWRSANREELLSSARQGVPPSTRRDTIGFRCVLARKPAPEPVKSAEAHLRE